MHLKTLKTRQKLHLNSENLIRPKIDKLSTTDFSIMEQALELGVQAALLVEPELKKLSVNAQAYLSYQQKKGKKSNKSLLIVYMINHGLKPFHNQLSILSIKTTHAQVPRLFVKN